MRVHGLTSGLFLLGRGVLSDFWISMDDVRIHLLSGVPEQSPGCCGQIGEPTLLVHNILVSRSRRTGHRQSRKWMITRGVFAKDISKASNQSSKETWGWRSLLRLWYSGLWSRLLNFFFYLRSILVVLLVNWVLVCRSATTTGAGMLGGRLTWTLGSIPIKRYSE